VLHPLPLMQPQLLLLLPLPPLQPLQPPTMRDFAQTVPVDISPPKLAIIIICLWTRRERERERNWRPLNLAPNSANSAELMRLCHTVVLLADFGPANARQRPINYPPHCWARSEPDSARSLACL